MKNLNNKEDSDFEKSWKDAFEGAELEPSEDVWLKIDGVLANQEAKGFKRTIVYYKYAAAVSLLLLLSTALLSYYLLNSNDDTAQQIANNNATNAESIVQYDSNKSAISKNNSENKRLDSPGDSEESDIIAENRSSINDNIKNEIEENIGGLSSNDDSFGGVNKDNISEKNKSNGAIIKDKREGIRKTDSQNNYNLQKQDNNRSQILISKNEADDDNSFNSTTENDEEQILRNTPNYVTLNPLTSKSHEALPFERKELQYEIYRVPVVQNKKDNKNNDNSSKRYFAGLQVSPGYFDPNIQMNSNGLIAGNSFFDSNRSVKLSQTLASQNIDSEAQPQVSYTYGLNFGFKVARRWLINMGLQYAKNNTSGTTSYVYNDNTRYLATPTSLNNFSNDAADYTESLNKNLNYNIPMGYHPYLEVYEFTSLPVKAGYVIVDKKLTWIISTGIATDFFLQSKSMDPSGKSDDQLVKSGESTNFKRVFFNGLGSSEIIYNISKNYSISLEPSFRAAISSFSKTDSQFTSHPKAFGIAAGFRYNF